MGGKNKGFVLTRPPASCFVRVFVYSQKENGTIWDVENLFFFCLICSQGEVLPFREKLSSALEFNRPTS